MILILAATADMTVHRVRRWLRHAGHSVLQIDCDDPIVDLEVAIDDAGEDARLTAQSGRTFCLSEVRALWYRRGELRLEPKLFGEGPAADERLGEWAALREWLMARLEAKPSLGSWDREVRCTKLEQLSAARGAGLPIPSTRVSCDRRRLASAIEAWPAAIQKGIQRGTAREEEEEEEEKNEKSEKKELAQRSAATSTLDARSLRAAPARFFPRLAQERVDRTIELRIFFLGRRLWSMAMLPRSDQAPPVDSRTADLDRAFHLLPYSLPKSVEERLIALMDALRLDTGSIDMLVGPGGRHTFLEVNPSGQLDWLARSLNAPIERLIAEHLADLATASQLVSAASPALSPPTRRRPPVQLGGSDEDFSERALRFTSSAGQTVLVRPPEKPILQRFAGATTQATAAPATAPKPTTIDPAPALNQASPIVDDEALSPEVFHLPATIELVEGSQGALLYDLQRGRAFAVPGSFVPQLRRGRTITAVGAEDRRALAATRRAIGLGVPSALTERFPPRSLAWASPAALTNAVIDVDGRSDHDFAAILSELIELGCEHVLLRIAHRRGLSLVDQLLPMLDDMPPLFLELWMTADDSITPAALIPRVGAWSRITSIVIFGAKASSQWLRPRSGVGSILARTEPLQLGAPAPPTIEGMLVRDELFRESIDHHPVFHRKIAIGTGGELRNSPGLSATFGRFGERPLREVIELAEFQRLGSIHRGRIAGCSECEFRRACSDSREPQLGADGHYHHTSTCPLDPRQRRRAELAGA